MPPDIHLMSLYYELRRHLRFIAWGRWEKSIFSALFLFALANLVLNLAIIFFR